MFSPKSLLCASAASLCFVSAAQAASIDITFSNTNGFGFLVTPVYTGIHDGTFDAFDEGSAASEGVAQTAELPVPPNLDGRGNLIAGERRADQDGDGVNSQGAFIANGGPIADGESVTITVDVTDPTVNQYATFLAMVVPSNDTFFGNDTADAYQIFDNNGDVIESTFVITASSIYDAGSEVNEFATSTQANILGSTEENGVITRLLEIDSDTNNDGIFEENGFNDLAALFSLPGFDQNDAFGIRASTEFFRISVTATPSAAPVPLPAGLPLLAFGLGAFGFAKRAKRKA